MTPSRRAFLKAAAAGAAAASLARCSAKPARRDPRPNVLVILADDLGIDALGCYGGGPYATPNLDAFAKDGLRFENCYATPHCTPSRVQFLTGRYPFRTGWTENYLERLDEAPPDAPRFVDPSLPTFGSVLGAAGYATALAGKWQLCSFAERPDHVRECGFDTYRCWLYLDPDAPPDKPVYTSRYFFPSTIENGTIRRNVKGAYGPVLYADFLIDFIRAHRDRPFLAFYSMTLPHGPFVGTPETANPATATRMRDDPRNFGPMVTFMDRQIGRVVRAVDDAYLGRDTVILFTADNGTSERVQVEYMGRTRFGGKGSFDEAGMRVPLLARWLGRIEPGGVCPDLIDLSDFMPTCADLAGTAPPDGTDGSSFARRLRGEGAAPREVAFVQHRDRRCVRGPRLKLYDDGRVFDVVADPLEQTDLAPDAAPGGRLADEVVRLRAVLASLR